MNTPNEVREEDVLLDIPEKKEEQNGENQLDINGEEKNEMQEKVKQLTFPGFEETAGDINTPKANAEEVRLTLEGGEGNNQTPQRFKKKKKSSKKAVAKLKPEDFPVFKCPKEGHEEKEVTHICTLPECPKRLLCPTCLETDHVDSKEYTKPYKDFFNEAQNMEVVKDQKIEEFEEFLQQKETFLKNLNFNYDKIVKTINKEVEAIKDAIWSKLMQVKEKVIDIKRKQYEEIKRSTEEYEKKFNEAYFEVDAKLQEAILNKKDDYVEFEKVCHEIIEAPNFKQREEIINFATNLNSKIKSLEDNFYNRRLKYVQNKVKKDINKLIDSVIQADRTVDTVTEYEWNPRSIELIKYHHTGAPVLALCEMEPGIVAAGYGFPEYCIEIFNTKETGVIKKLKGHTKSITALMYMPAQQTLVSASCDQYLKGWKLDQEEPIWTIKAHQNFIFGLARLEDDIFATSSHDKFIKIWKMGKNTPRAVLYGHSDAVWCVVGLQEPEMLASCSADGRIIIWDYESAEAIRRIKAHKDQVNQIVTHQENMLISASDDNTVKLWDWKTGEMIAQLLNIQNPVWGVLVAHDNETLFCYGEQANVVIYNMRESTVINVLYGFDQSVKTMIETLDNFVVSGSYDYKVRYWNCIKME